MPTDCLHAAHVCVSTVSSVTGCFAWQDTRPKTGLQELSLLATLIKPNAGKVSNFKLNLFGEGAAPEPAASGVHQLAHCPPQNVKAGTGAAACY